MIFRAGQDACDTKERDAMLVTLSINENPYLGVLCKASDDILVVPVNVGKRSATEMASALECEVLKTCIGGTTMIGALLTINSNGAVVSNLAEESELRKFKQAGINVVCLEDKMNALGNIILANDKKALVHPNLSPKSEKAIADALGVEVARGTIAGLKTVGSAAAATNRGVLCHPKATEEEITALKELFKLKVETGTVNYGMPFIGAGIVANSKGAAVGDETTGIEMNRIERTLGFLD